MRRLSTFAPKLSLLTALVALSAVGCGGKGDDDDAAAPPAGPETVFGFDSTTEGFTFQDYDPGGPDDGMYENLASTMDPKHDHTGTAASNAVITWDGGNGPDGKPGRLKLVMQFTDFNQLADIQVNFMGENTKIWDGKKVKAKVMLESGFSMDPSYPGGTYIFLKTGVDYVWAKGSDQNLEQTLLNTWNTAVFNTEVPGQANPGFDPVATVSLGLQFYSNGGAAGAAKPMVAPVYVDDFTVEDLPPE